MLSAPLAVAAESDNPDGTPTPNLSGIYKAFFPRIGHYFGFMAARVEPGRDHVIGYCTEPLDAAYPIERPLEVGRHWIDGSVLTWLVLAPA